MRGLLDSVNEVMAKSQPSSPVMWPETLGHLITMDRRHQWDPETLEEESLLVREKAFADPERLMELLQSSEAGLNQLATLAKQWEKRQANAVLLLRQRLETVNVQRIEAERKHRQILEEQWSSRLNTYPVKRENGNDPTSSMEEDETSSSGGSGSRGSLVGSVSGCYGDDLDGSLEYWKEKAKTLDRLLSESLQREQVLQSRLHENLVEPIASLPLEELQDHLHRLDNFLHFTLRKAPVVLGHQDKELRYRFVYNAFPSLTEEEVMGKTDREIYSGDGVEELMEFKRQVLQRGFPAKREILFDTDLFGQKAFLVAVEPVFSKTGDTIGINYVAMDVTDEAAHRERIISLREDIAVKNALESELNKSYIDITEETMRAKQMLATMSHEIRSPLSGVVSMAEVLATTKLDTEQRQLVDVMMSSGDLVLQLINDILDLSKVESGAMKLESKKFRPREVVKHVLQMTLPSVQHKNLVVKGEVEDEVPLEVIGDVLRIRQVFTNLVSNAIKFTHKGVVSIKMRLEPNPDTPTSSTAYAKVQTNKTCKAVNNVGPSFTSGSSSLTQMISHQQDSPPRLLAQNSSEVDIRLEPKGGSDFSQISRSTSTASSVSSLPSTSSTASSLSSAFSFTANSLDEVSGVEEAAELRSADTGRMLESAKPYDGDEVIWLHCEVCDTGIGIPEAALPSLFEKYTQVSTTHARKYGGTGLGLAICKQLVGLMGGTLKVASKENEGSNFSFTLPLKAVKEKPSPVPLNDKVYRMISNPQEKADMSSKKRGHIQFTPNVIFSTAGSTRPLVHSPSTDGKGKNGKPDVSKLRQMYGESFANCSQPGGRNQSGETKNTGDKVLAKEENKLLSSSRDVTGSASSLSSCDSSSDLKHRRGSAATTETISDLSASVKPNIPKNNIGGSEVSVPPLPPARVLNPGPNAEQRARRLPKILLAEDNTVNVMVAQTMLKRLGHSLEVVSNGAEAIHAYRKSNYDLILMDVSMPVMDGLEATRLIRRFEETGQWLYSEGNGEAEGSGSSASSTDKSASRKALNSETAGMLIASPRPRTPIIAMTANALADNVVECYSHGMDSFIAKPVSFQKLEQVLREFIPWLDHQRGVLCC